MLALGLTVVHAALYNTSKVDMYTVGRDQEKMKCEYIVLWIKKEAVYCMHDCMHNMTVSDEVHLRRHVYIYF